MSGLRRLRERLLSVGAYPEEPSIQRGKRRIVVGLVWATLPFLALTTVGFASEGKPWLAVLFLFGTADAVATLLLLRLRPLWFKWIVNAQFLLILVEPLVETVMRGGIQESGATIMFGLLAVLGSLIVFDSRAALWWFVGFIVTVVVAVTLAEAMDPLYEPVSSVETGGNVLTIALLVFAVMAYFVRQRDRFQKESDDLLHNILPDEIAARLKEEASMIADDFPEASVLFADVVGFTPMSAGMAAPQLVGLLNQVFTKFDELVDELGLEKVKTVGDEYMVAAGVPTPRDDHAAAIAEFALEIRDFLATNRFDGRTLQARIGIHSGPVVAGIIGTHKFAYDLWGDTVNTASRMESEGIPGEIQVTPFTRELLAGDSYSFEPRGTIDVKGMGQMKTWLLVGRN